MPTLADGAEFGRYEIVGLLGAGGMAEVYRARDPILGRQLAIKVLSDRTIQDDRRIARLRLEATTASALNHPNIVTVYEIGEVAGSLYVALELIDGRTIREQLLAGALDLASAVRIGAQIADGLAKAHAAGMVHRDLKPENVMVTSDGLAKILDFGLAKITAFSQGGDTATRDEETQPGILLGTYAYMSPEQASGLPVDFHSDQFSLGVMLHEMVTGRHPFRRATAAQTMAAIIEQPAPPLSAELSGRAPLGAVIGRCLEKRPEGRYGSTRDLAHDLWALASHVDDPAWLTAQPKPRPRRRAVIDSIAVLPLVNAIGDPDADYLTEGVTEAIISALSRLPRLKVMARSTVFRYKSRVDDARQVGVELGVKATLTGRVQSRDEALLVSVELADVERGTHLWGAQYHRKLDQVWTIHEAVAAELGAVLRLRPAGRRKGAAASAPSNPEAYQLYLRGQFFWNKRSPEALPRAIHYFELATQRDPGFALAFAGLACAYGVLGASEFATLPPRQVMPKAREAAIRAVELDGSRAETHLALAPVKFWFDWDWKGAEDDLRRAINLNPGYATAHLWYAEYLSAMGRFDESIAEARRAQSLDPLSVTAFWTLGRVLNFSGDYTGVLREMEKALELEPTFDRLYYLVAWAQLALGRPDEGLATMQRAIALGGQNLFKTVLMGHYYGIIGREADARRILEEVTEAAKTRFVHAFDFAILHIALAEYDRAFEWLDRTVEERSAWIPYLRVTPLLDRIRSDPRFGVLTRRVALP